MAGAVIVFPGPVATVVPLPIAVLIALFSVLAISASVKDREKGLASVVNGGGLLAVLVAACFAILTSGVAEKFGPASTYVVLFPLALYVGWSCGTGHVLGHLLAMFRILCVPAACISIAERIAMHQLVPSDFDSPESIVRATAGQPHPIVLGVVLTAGMATLVAVRPAARAVLAALFMAGIFCTASAGPLLVGAVLVVLLFIPVAHRVFEYWVWILGVGGLIGTLFALFVWRPEIRGTTVNEYSDGYRSALYALAPRILKDAPFGYGLDGLPPARWVFSTEYLGARDVSETVDSEPVLLMAAFGVVGLTAFALIFWGFGQLFRLGFEMEGLVGVAITANGLTVALSSWPNIAAIWFLVAGFAAWHLNSARKSRAAP